MKTIVLPEYITTYQLVFSIVDEAYGWSFDCDEQGNVDRSTLTPMALINLEKCNRREYPVSSGVVVEREHHVPGYTLVTCDCGREVYCQGFTSTCYCGRDYNWNGDLLAPRSQWGEETGETAADILSL